MATSAAAVLSNMQSNSLGSSGAATWHAMFKLAGHAAVGSSSGKPYSEMAAHFDNVLGSDHPVTKRYRTDFAAELNREAQR